MKISNIIFPVMQFFDESVKTEARKRIISTLMCGIGAAVFSTGIAIGTARISNNEKNENDSNERGLGEDTEN